MISENTLIYTSTEVKQIQNADNLQSIHNGLIIENEFSIISCSKNQKIFSIENKGKGIKKIKRHLQKEKVQPHFFCASELQKGDWTGYRIPESNTQQSHFTESFLQFYGLMIQFGYQLIEFPGTFCIKLDYQYNKHDIQFIKEYLDKGHYGSYYNNGYMHFTWYDSDFSSSLIYNNINCKEIHKLFMNLTLTETKFIIGFILEKQHFKHINDTLTLQLRLLLLKCGILTFPKKMSLRNGVSKSLYYCFINENKVLTFDDKQWIQITSIKKSKKSMLCDIGNVI
jgi:hypothetical protein